MNDIQGVKMNSLTPMKSCLGGKGRSKVPGYYAQPSCFSDFPSFSPRK